MSMESELRKYARELGTSEHVSLVARVRIVTKRNLNILLPATHHAVLVIWDSQLPDGRALMFLGPKEEAAKAAKQRIRADIIHQLFPRAILLTERHRRAPFCHSSAFSRLSIEVSGNTSDIVWAADANNATITLSEDCWKIILPHGFSPRVRTTVENLFNIVGRDENSVTEWHHVVDAGRTLREEFGKALLAMTKAFQDSSSSLPEPIHKRLRGWINGTNLDDVCAHRLVILAKQLAERHSVHEGRQLHYRFAYAPSAALWQEIEDVLSFEASDDVTRNGARSNTGAIEEQAKLIEAHWSIFQPERVFGIVDTLMSQQMPRLQRVVRVRPPARWSALESEAMDSLAKAAKPCLAVVVLRQWLVRLSFSKDGAAGDTFDTLEWDIREPREKPPQANTEILKNLATVARIDKDGGRVESMLATVLSEVSEATGEGALLIAVGNGKGKHVVKHTCMEMDSPTKQMAWRSSKRLQWVDRTLLRAMLILDGATVIQPDGDKEAIIRPRLVVYPVVTCKKHPTGFSVISWKKPRWEPGCTCPTLDEDEITRVQSNLLGKGSRKHGGANIAVLLEQHTDATLVVSVSADGPIEKWPPKPEQ